MQQSDLVDILLVSSDFVFITTDREGVILSVTPAVRDIFNLQEGEVEGRSLAQLIPELGHCAAGDFEAIQPRGGLELMSDDESCSTGSDYLEYLAAYEQTTGHFEVESQIGEQPHWLQLVTNKVLHDGEIIFTVMFSKITQRKKNEFEIRDLNQNLEARVEARTEQIKNVVRSCSTELEHVNKTYQEMKERQMSIMESLESKVLAKADGLSDTQSEQLAEALRTELIQSMNLYSEDQITDQKFMLTMMSLSELLGGKSASSDNLTPDQLSGASQDDVDDLLDSLGI